MTPTLTTFLSAFFPGDDEKIHLRSLPPRGVKGSAENLTVFREWFTRPVPQKKLKELNETRGMYFVVNSGGHSDEEISRLTACFVEADDIPIAEQHAKLDAAPLQPSIRIETRKSVHAHWLLAGEVTADRLGDWREAQRRLIAYFGGDPSIKNPSRVMRLPYFDHISKDGSRKRIELAVFEPNRRYTLDDLLATFPPAPEETEPKPKKPKAGASIGNGYATWDALHAELGRRMMAHESANKNRAGKWDVRGICHDGQGDTGAFFDPSKNRGRCNVCDEATMLRGWGLPEKPEPPAQSKRQTKQTGDKQADETPDVGDVDLDGDVETGERRQSKASMVVEMAADAELFHNAEGRTYARVPVNSHIETWPLRSSSFKRWLGARFWQEHKATIHPPAIAEALQTLDGRAMYEGDQREVHIRIAEHDSNIYLDLCDATWRVVEITADGWRVISAKDCPVHFRR